MIRKCVNTIKYGTAKARAIVLLSLLFGIGAVGAIVCAIVFRQILLIFAAVVCVFVVITLAQTLIIQGGVVEDAENAETQDTKRPKRMKPPVFEKRKNEKTVDREDSKEEFEDAGSSDEDIEEKHDRHKRKKQHKKESDEVRQKMQDKQEQTEEQPIVALTQETVTTYDRKKVKKTLHKFKVRRDHRMIFVDRSDKLKVKQTPAYIWVEKKEFHLLLIEQEPRHITIPLYQIKNITYLKKQQANEDIDYAAYKGSSVLADMFRPYLPDYAHSTVVDDLSAYKNLYGIGNDIYVTNRSASALFDLLGVEFQVDDRVTMSNKVNIYFKEAYKSNILLRDNVIDANGYADRISKTLDNLAHSTISYAEFKDTLNLMIRNKLITQEFASYYMGVRDDLTR